MSFKRILINSVFFLKNIGSIVLLKREKAISALLLKNAIKISIAESCTGGLISSRLTDISGSSAYIFENFVTYANSAKVQLLGVNKNTIDKYGVVSSEVALEMAEGLLKNYNCSLAIATTGIAGPLGASETKPVGLIYIAIANNKIKKAYKFEANSLLYRRIMKYTFSNKALDLLLDFLRENY